MDLSVYDRIDIPSRIQLERLSSIKINQNRAPNEVKIAILYGAKNARQSQAVLHAVNLAKKYFFDNYEVKLDTDDIINDDIFNEHHWKPWDLFKHITKSDIHIIPTHGHQGTIGRGLNGDAWTVHAYFHAMSLLECHLGYPMGKYLSCPVFTQDKVKN